MKVLGIKGENNQEVSHEKYELGRTGSTNFMEAYLKGYYISRFIKFTHAHK